MSQETSPFENRIHAVAAREDLQPEDDDEVGVLNADPETSATDVFIVEGREERYGSKDVWAVAIRC